MLTELGKKFVLRPQAPESPDEARNIRKQDLCDTEHPNGLAVTKTPRPWYSFPSRLVKQDGTRSVRITKSEGQCGVVERAMELERWKTGFESPCGHGNTLGEWNQ